jgi:hypothetical protein
VKPDTPLGTRQVIAGRQQAKASNVLRPSFAATLDWVVREMENEKLRLSELGSSAEPSLSDVLTQVYSKTGRSAGVDGILVCSLGP